METSDKIYESNAIVLDCWW